MPYFTKIIPIFDVSNVIDGSCIEVGIFLVPFSPVKPKQR